MALIGMAISSNSRPESEDSDSTQSDNPTQVEAQPFDESDGAQATGEPGDSPSVTISTENGDVDVRFDPDGVARASSSDQSGEFDLPQGSDSSLRLNEDGQLEPVSPGELGSDDVGLTASPNGVDVNAPDNPLVELRPDGFQGGVSATELDGDQATPLTPDSGEVTLNDGTTISPIEAPGDGLIVVTGSVRNMPWTLIFATIAILALVSATTGYVLHRNRAEELYAATGYESSGRVDEDFEQFLARLAADPDPTRAIRLGFHAIEQGQGGLPIRRNEETPFEWHRRTSDLMPAVEGPLGEICDLFAKVRFAPGDATIVDRDQMILQLRRLRQVAHTPSPSRPSVLAN